MQLSETNAGQEYPEKIYSVIELRALLGSDILQSLAKTSLGFATSFHEYEYRKGNKTPLEIAKQMATDDLILHAARVAKVPTRTDDAEIVAEIARVLGKEEYEVRSMIGTILEEESISE